MCKLGVNSVIFQKRLKIDYYWVLIGSHICHVNWHNNRRPRVTLSGRIARYLCSSWVSCITYLCLCVCASKNHSQATGLPSQRHSSSAMSCFLIFPALCIEVCVLWLYVNFELFAFALCSSSKAARRNDVKQNNFVASCITDRCWNCDVIRGSVISVLKCRWPCSSGLLGKCHCIARLVGQRSALYIDESDYMPEFTLSGFHCIKGWTVQGHNWKIWLFSFITHSCILQNMADKQKINEDNVN